MKHPDIAEHLIEAARSGDFEAALADVCETNFIAGMHMKKGSFTAQAQSHGETPAEFQHDVLAHPSKFDPKTVHRANLRKTLVKLN